MLPVHNTITNNNMYIQNINKLARKIPQYQYKNKFKKF
jgi:hypothetical protein